MFSHSNDNEQKPEGKPVQARCDASVSGLLYMIVQLYVFLTYVHNSKKGLLLSSFQGRT